MSFISWSDTLLVGVAAADDQHRQLVAMANRLHDAMADQVPDRHLVGEVLEGLMDYTMNHFITEEELFQRLGYPGAEQHKREHDQFTATVLGHLQRHEAGETVALGVMNTLRDWLVNHIMKSDKAYGIYFADRGLV
jgi:hemerythrin